MDFDTFWKQFLIECQEHIDILEGHLLSAEHGSIDKAGISELFRAFHSIKGLSKTMDLTGIETIAHVCEDILGLVRDKGVDFSIESVDVLLQGVDSIKKMVEETCQIRENTNAPEHVLQQLRHLRDDMAKKCENDLIDLPEDPVMDSSSTDSALENPQEESNEFIPYFTEEITTPDIVISHDDDTVHYFLEAVMEELKALLHYNIDIDQDKLKIQNAINTLRHSYVMMGFSNIMFALEEVLYCVNDGKVQYYINLSRIFTDLHQMTLNTGMPLLSPMDNPVLETEKEIFKQKAKFIQEYISCALRNDPLPYADKDMIDLTLSLGFSLSNAYPDMPVALFLDCEMILRHIHDRYSIESMNDTLQSLDVFLIAFISFLNEPEQTIDAISKLLIVEHEKVAAFIQTLPGQSVPISNQNTNTSLDTAFVETVGDDLLSGLQKRFKEQGETQLFVLLTYLEADQNVGEQFAMFATKQCELPFNRSVFINNQNWYEFLLIYPHSEEQLEEELRKIDPHEKYLKLNKEQTNHLRKIVQQGIKHLVANDMILEQLAAPDHQNEQEDFALVSKKHMAPLNSNATPSSALNTDTIRIPGDILDKFMNDIGEMVLACSHLNFTVGSHSFKTTLHDLHSQIKLLIEKEKIQRNEVFDIFKSISELEKIQKSVVESNTLIHSILRYLQESALNLRVIPLESVFKRLPRIVRDVSKQLDKKINLVLEGQEVRVDKSMVETLVDPLIHMLRNSIDHGIETPNERLEAGKNETGLIRISAVQQGNQIRIDVSDDGHGLDPDKIRAKAIQKGLIEEDTNLSLDDIHQLIFHPGFSTASVVTEVSGRGVGMDVVKSNVTKVGGSIAIESEKNHGTKISLKMPISAAIQEVLIVKASHQILALPSRFVIEIVEIHPNQLMSIKGHPAVLLRDHFLPLSHLGYLLGFPKDPCQEDKKMTIVVLSDGQFTLGLHVEEVVNRGELYMKDVHQGIINLPGVGGASILGDGRVVLVLDGEGILFLATKSKATPYAIKEHIFIDENDAKATLDNNLFSEDPQEEHDKSLENNGLDKRLKDIMLDDVLF